MALINDVFRPLLDKCVIVYLNNILVYSKTKSEHLEHLKQVLKLLRKNHLFAKISKCAFLKNSVKFLGHVVSSKGLAVNLHKIDAVQQWPIPTNLHKLRSFLGLAAYYHQFVQGFSKIATNLTALLAKNRPYI